MGRKYSAELKAARHVRVVLNANVVDIETDPDARTVRRLKCRTLSGRSFAAKGSKFILATGGIENARLLLAANTVRPNGLGNDHDVVGRYYLEHPRLYSGSIRFNGDWGRNMMYDIKFHYHNAAVQAFGQKFAGAFALTRETQEAERVMNGRVWLCSMFPGDEQPAAKSLERIKHRLERKEEPGPTLLEDLFTVARSPLQTAGFLGGRLFRLRSLIRDVRFQAIVEPNPDPESRITLLPHSRDALGMPRVKVTWQLGDIVRRTFDRNFAILADEMRLAGIAQTTLDAPMEGTGGWHPTFENQGTWHHMGSTRMHDSPKYGVVDRNCRVHGMSNLFVAGSSVFTTGAANLPTQTIVALTLRLSDHLADRLREAEATAQALPA
jgi:choline dehydrogenase-like flavoprotein